MILLNVVQEVRFKLLNLVHRHVVQESLRAGVDGEHLIRDRHRFILPLLEQLHHAHATSQLQLRRLVELASKLGKRRHFTILSEIQPERTGHLFHRLNLSGSADAGD